MGDRLRYGFCGAALEECAWAWEWNATAAMRHRQGYMGIMRRGNSAYAPQKGCEYRGTAERPQQKGQRGFLLVFPPCPQAQGEEEDKCVGKP